MAEPQTLRPRHTTDQVLEHLATSNIPGCRLIAIAQLTDQELIERIAINTEESDEVRTEAINKAQIEAIKKLENQNTIVQIATNPEESDGVRIQAIKKLENQKILRELLTDPTSYIDIRLVAITLLTDQKTLEQIATNPEESDKVRIQAIKKLKNQKILRELLTNENKDILLAVAQNPNTPTDVLESMALYGTDILPVAPQIQVTTNPEIQAAAIRRDVLNQSTLKEISINNESFPLARTAAIELLETQDTLAKIALDKEDDVNVRAAAVKRLTNPSTLEEIINESDVDPILLLAVIENENTSESTIWKITTSDNATNIQIEAIEKLHSLEKLKTLFQHGNLADEDGSGSRSIRVSALKRIKCQPFLLELTLDRQVSYETRLIAVDGLGQSSLKRAANSLLIDPSQRKCSDCIQIATSVLARIDDTEVLNDWLVFLKESPLAEDYSVLASNPCLDVDRFIGLFGYENSDVKLALLSNPSCPVSVRRDITDQAITDLKSDTDSMVRGVVDVGNIFWLRIADVMDELSDAQVESWSSVVSLIFTSETVKNRDHKFLVALLSCLPSDTLTALHSTANASSKAFKPSSIGSDDSIDMIRALAGDVMLEAGEGWHVQGFSPLEYNLLTEFLTINRIRFNPESRADRTWMWSALTNIPPEERTSLKKYLSTGKNPESLNLPEFIGKMKQTLFLDHHDNIQAEQEQKMIQASGEILEPEIASFLPLELTFPQRIKFRLNSKFRTKLIVEGLEAAYQKLENRKPDNLDHLIRVRQLPGVQSDQVQTRSQIIKAMTAIFNRENDTGIRTGEFEFLFNNGLIEEIRNDEYYYFERTQKLEVAGELLTEDDYQQSIDEARQELLQTQPEAASYLDWREKVNNQIHTIQVMAQTRRNYINSSSDRVKNNQTLHSFHTITIQSENSNPDTTTRLRLTDKGLKVLQQLLEEDPNQDWETIQQELTENLNNPNHPINNPDKLALQTNLQQQLHTPDDIQPATAASTQNPPTLENLIDNPPNLEDEETLEEIIGLFSEKPAETLQIYKRLQEKTPKSIEVTQTPEQQEEGKLYSDLANLILALSKFPIQIATTTITLEQAYGQTHKPGPEQISGGIHKFPQQPALLALTFFYQQNPGKLKIPVVKKGEKQRWIRFKEQQAIQTETGLTPEQLTNPEISNLLNPDIVTIFTNPETIGKINVQQMQDIITLRRNLTGQAKLQPRKPTRLEHQIYIINTGHELTHGEYQSIWELTPKTEKETKHTQENGFPPPTLLQKLEQTLNWVAYTQNQTMSQSNNQRTKTLEIPTNPPKPQNLQTKNLVSPANLANLQIKPSQLALPPAHDRQAELKQ